MSSTENKTQFEKYKNLGFFLILMLLSTDIYYNYYAWFLDWGLTHPYALHVMGILSRTGMFNSTFYPKLFVLLLTGLFVLMDKGRKDVEMDKRDAATAVLSSTIAFISTALLPLITDNLFIYAALLLASYIFMLRSFHLFRRLFDTETLHDRENKRNKLFDQMTELMENDLSVNIPFEFVSAYRKTRKGLKPVLSNGFINIVAPERASIIFGKPGSGKSYSFNEEFLRQHIIKGFSMINYDYKFPTLTKINYNYYRTYNDSYAHYPSSKFAIINLDDPRYSDRCNPVHPDLLEMKSHAIDAVKTIFFNLDKKSASKPDFFQLSAMAITSAALWFLKMYDDGKYCSIPHLIEFVTQSDEKILPILDNYPELRYFTSSFTDALKKQSFEQLSGQTASARIPLGQLATEEMFWVMTDPDGEGVNLRVNLPEEPTILNIANNPETQKTNGPALGLYMSQAAKLINQQGRVPCTFHVDELPTIYINGLDNLIATARSNKVCTVLSAQDYSQLVAEYGKEIADKTLNTIDNLFCGKVAIDTAKKVSEAIGKHNYRTQSVSIGQDSTSTSINTQRDFKVPPEDISQLSQGEFVGIVSDTFGQQIELKAFRGFVSPSKRDQGNEPVPMKYPEITKETIAENAKRIQQEVSDIILEEQSRMLAEQQDEAEMHSEELRGNIEQEFNGQDVIHEIYDREEQSGTQVVDGDPETDALDQERLRTLVEQVPDLYTDDRNNLASDGANDWEGLLDEDLSG